MRAETGKFEEVKEFTELTEGTLNEYVWRMGEYDGDLYGNTAQTRRAACAVGIVVKAFKSRRESCRISEDFWAI